MGAAHLGWNTTLETLMRLGTTQWRLATIFHHLCITYFITQLDYTNFHFTASELLYPAVMPARQQI